MAGETDLARLLATLHPALDGTVYGFATLPPGIEPPSTLPLLALFREDEGLSLIAPVQALAALGIAHDGGWARITLTVHSALAAVGLTAAVSRALTEAGISANVVAAYHHDHVFVPWPRREEALAALETLSRS